MHIYAFGSICRGDLTIESDVDLLAIVEGYDNRFDPNKFSIYSYKRISELWKMGNAFAWHLHLESRLIFTEDGIDFLSSKGSPNRYQQASVDCNRFRELFESSYDALRDKTQSTVFELSTIFLSIRNIATCYSLKVRGEANFGRDAAIRLGSLNVPFTDSAYQTIRRARLLSTRGIGGYISPEEVLTVINECKEVNEWIEKISREIQLNG